VELYAADAKAIAPIPTAATADCATAGRLYHAPAGPTHEAIQHGSDNAPDGRQTDDAAGQNRTEPDRTGQRDFPKTALALSLRLSGFLSACPVCGLCTATVIRRMVRLTRCRER